MDDSRPRDPSLRGRAARGGAVTLLAQAAKVILSVVSVVVLSRLIAPGDFGLLVMVTAISGVASIFLDFGLSMAALRSAALTQQQQSNLFWINATTGVVLGGAIFVMSWAIAGFYEEPRLVEVVQWLSMTLVLGGFTVQFRISLNRRLRFTALAVAEVSAPIIGLAVAVALAANGAGLQALVAQQIVGAAALFLFTVVQARWMPSLPRRTAGMRQLLRFGGGMAATQLLSYATRNIDSIAIGRVWGATELGYYDRAYRLSVAPVTQLNQPMTRVAMPVLSQFHEEPKRFMSALREGQLIACYVTASLLLVAAGIAEPLVKVLLGPEWSAAGNLLSILAIGATFRSMQQVANWVFFAKGLAGPLLKFNLVAQPLIVVAILAGLPWGATGVAVGGSVGYAAYWLASFYWAGRAAALDLRPLVSNALRIIVTFGLPAGLFAWLAASFLPLSPFLQLIGGVVAALIWYIVIYAVSGATRRDIAKLWRFVRLAVGRR